MVENPNPDYGGGLRKMLALEIKAGRDNVIHAATVDLVRITNKVLSQWLEEERVKFVKQ